VKRLVMTLRQFGLGLLAGSGVAGAVSLFGYRNGGWNPAAGAGALAIALSLALIIVLTFVTRVGYGHTFRRQATEDETNRRASMIPFVVGVAAAIMVVYFAVAPPTIPPGTLIQEPQTQGG
jgi:formate hydrogenlyase subunit 3/multisubunit Na+/H+ antiporter MnhD subunit